MTVAIALRPEAAILGPTVALSDFAIDTGRHVPEAVRLLIRTCLLDFIGIAAFSGRFADSSASFRAFLDLDPAVGPTTVIGDERTYSAPYAALLNGAFAHSMDFDDTNGAAALHPGAPVIAAALAQAERLGSSGSALIDAVAVGYEVCCRVGGGLTTAGYDRGFHMTSVAGIFGAVAAAGRLAGVSARVMENAFGLALSRAAGSMQYLANGAWNKRLHPGFAAQDALVCLVMAQAGAVGASEALEGKQGLLHTHTEAPDPDAITRDLGQVWVTLDTALKPYPSCRLTHSAVDAALALRERVPADQRGACRLEVRLSPTAFKIVGEPSPNKLAARNIVDGQFSAYFQTAIAWLDGQPTWTMYERVGDAAVDAMAARIAIVSDPSVLRLGCVVKVEAPDGPLSLTVLNPLGEPDSPMLWPAALEKFRGLAEPVFGPAGAAAISQAVAGLPGLADVRDLTQLLRG
uniref:MmgE/PrpD family protein n=1 Tax=Caulobacter sp. (strain K31) TaxID=366602 RepID=B0T6L3_CAUSK